MCLLLLMNSSLWVLFFSHFVFCFCFILNKSIEQVLLVHSSSQSCCSVVSLYLLLGLSQRADNFYFAYEKGLHVLWHEMWMKMYFVWICCMFCASLWTQKRPPLLRLLYKTGQSLHLEELFLAVPMLVNLCWWSVLLDLWVNEMELLCTGQRVIVSFD
jgi:hypothetical protein